jgi:hypothetical protein
VGGESGRGWKRENEVYKERKRIYPKGYSQRGKYLAEAAFSSF